jgi:polysaccharide biosynthesis transport protein
VVATLMAAGIWLAMPSGKHRVQATLQFKSRQTNLLSGGNESIAQNEFDVQIENHKKLMETKAFLDSVAADTAVAKLATMEAAPRDERALVIRNMLTFKRESYEIVTLTLNGDEPDDMQVILRALVAKYIAKDKDEESKQRKHTLEQVTAMLGELQGKIEKQREKMQADANRQGSSDAVTLGLLTSRITAAEQNFQKAKDDAVDFKNKRDQLSEQIAAGKFAPDPTDLEDVFRNSTQVAEKRKLLAVARDTADKLAKAFKPGDESRTEAEAKVKAAEKAVSDAEKDALSVAGDGLKAKQKLKLESQLTDLGNKYELAQKAMETHKSTLDAAVKERSGLTNGETSQRMFEREAEPLEKQKEALLKQKSDLELVDKNASQRIEILEDAQIYKNFNLKQKTAFAAVAAVAGLLGVFLLVSYVEWRNRRVDGVDQVVTELGMRVIGTIPAFPSRAALRNGDSGANQNWRFILNESVNSTRTMLLHTARTQQMQVILITSAMQGEGKTSLSSQLATSMATAGLRTLILDCDLRNPSMQKLFDVPVAPGCAEILLQEIDTSDAVQQTSVPNLWIIPAGQCNHRVIAALAQGHPIEALLNRLRGQFDIIIVDSCPILPVADTLLVAQHADAVVFSILQDVSQLPKVQDASDRLVQLNIPLLGAVVNGIKPDVQAYGYNYVKQLPA